jgi:putative intracellular protease/amidase
MTLSFISFNTGPVSSRVSEHRMAPGDAPLDLSMVLSPSTVATHTFADAPSLDVILIPGGLGNVLNDVNNDTTIQKFLNNRYAAANYILSVCTGSVELARAGLLKGKRATTNKGFWDWVTNPKHGEGIEWVPSARWTEDGKIWTSSGVAAGMDMTYAFLKMMYGTEQLDAVMNGIEYAPHQDPHWDPFSIVHKVSVITSGMGGCC